MKKKIICIFGPTASGKSQLAIDLATKLNGVILNIDSKQLYFYLEKLTASPEESNILHYGYNFLSCSENVNANYFLSFLKNFIEQTTYDYYILVGGTGFYIKYFFDNYENIYFSNADHNINDFYINCIKNFEKLISINDSKIHFNDHFRKYNFIKKKLKIFDIFHALPHYNCNDSIIFNSTNEINMHIEQKTDIKKFFISIRPNKELLKSKIYKRTPLLIDEKTIQEALFIHENLNYSHTFSHLIGFKEIVDHPRIDDTLINSIIRKTIQYSKQQYKWMNNKYISDYIFETIYEKNDNLNILMDKIYLKLNS